MEDQEAVTRAELSTPAKSDVFNRLYAGRKVDVKTKSQAAGAENEKLATSKAKGRPVLSRFSGSKVDGQRQVVGRRFSFKTPGTSASQRLKPKAASANQPDRVPPSVKVAKNKLQSAKYWLSIVGVAEKAENHLVAVGLFRLAISCSAEPTSEVRKAYAAYRVRYNLEQLTEPSQEYLNVEAEEEVEPDPSKVCNVEVQCPGAGFVEGFDELEAICDDGGLEPDEDIEKKKKMEGVKNLYEEEYSRIPAKEPEPSAGNHSVSEVINLDDVQDVTSPPRPLERNATPMRVRSTPLRASAIRASQRIEESAKKQTRRKFPQHKTETATPAKATGLEVDKMDVNTLMKEVVGLLAGSCNEVQSPAKEPAKVVADSPNKTNKTADSKPGKKPSKLSSKEQSEVVNESIVNGNNISEKENVLHCVATDEESKELSKAAPSPGEGTKRRLRSTPKKISKAPFL